MTGHKPHRLIFLCRFLFAVYLQRRSDALADQQDSLRHTIDSVSGPGPLAQRARDLGMVPAETAAFLRLPDGKVLGVAKKAKANDRFSVVTESKAPTRSTPVSSTPAASAGTPAATKPGAPPKNPSTTTPSKGAGGAKPTTPSPAPTTP